MLKQTVIILLFACLATVKMQAGEPGHSPGSYQGTLKTGMVAIGGETTGTILTTKSGARFELDFGRNAELAKLAGKLNGEIVVVSGERVVRGGIEIKERQVIVVESLKTLVKPDK